MVSYKRFKSTSNRVREFNPGLLSQGQVPSVLGKRRNMLELGQERAAEQEARQSQAPRVTAFLRQAIVEAGLEVGEIPQDLDDYLQSLPSAPADEDTSELWVDEDDDDAATHGLSNAEIAMNRARLHAIIGLYGGRVRGRDCRTRMERRRAADHAWAAITPELLDAYVHWTYAGADARNEARDESSSSSFTVQMIGLSEYSEAMVIEQGPHEPNIALARHGLLGAAPYLPSLAFSFDLLEFYRHLRRRQPTFGIQAFAKVICAFHNLLYYPKLQEKLSRAFDVYLDIHRRLQHATDEALG
ncbi:hypothetical protein FA95DRAFT_1613051 [Auriscalpium vulgare]|uniref:Uncharacterized protein n=1 Tax=Auriscalpium vulgare TaxID=40419 RepID=A0ACB8R4M8_9AGAM|nr:hypothetical protein FA95DRAFT_1613051 [Auriscalpium vulgare]